MAGFKGNIKTDEETSIGEDEPILRAKSSDKEDDKTKILLISVGVGLVLVISLAVFIVTMNKQKRAQEEALEQARQEQTLIEQQQAEAEKVEPGVVDMYAPVEGKNESSISDTPNFVRDLNGRNVSSNYTVLEVETVTDLIAYKKYRAVMGNGLEFYWLEATYEKMPYIVQVPYSIYSKLKDEGYVAVDLEILNLDNESQVITSMTVNKSVMQDMR